MDKNILAEYQKRVENIQTESETRKQAIADELEAVNRSFVVSKTQLGRRLNDEKARLDELKARVEAKKQEILTRLGTSQSQMEATKVEMQKSIEENEKSARENEEKLQRYSLILETSSELNDTIIYKGAKGGVDRCQASVAEARKAISILEGEIAELEKKIGEVDSFRQRTEGESGELIAPMEMQEIEQLEQTIKLLDDEYRQKYGEVIEKEAIENRQRKAKEEQEKVDEEAREAIQQVVGELQTRKGEITKQLVDNRDLIEKTKDKIAKYQATREFYQNASELYDHDGANEQEIKGCDDAIEKANRQIQDLIEEISQLEEEEKAIDSILEVIMVTRLNTPQPEPQPRPQPQSQPQSQPQPQPQPQQPTDQKTVKKVKTAGVYINEYGLPNYYAIIIDETGKEVETINATGFDNIVTELSPELNSRVAQNLKKYYDVGLANLLKQVDEKYSINAMKSYMQLLEGNSNDTLTDVEYDFTDLSQMPENKEDKSKLKYLRELANASYKAGLASYEKQPIASKIKSFFSRMKTKLLSEGKEQSQEPEIQEKTREERIREVYEDLSQEQGFTIKQFARAYQLSPDEVKAYEKRYREDSFARRETERARKVNKFKEELKVDSSTLDKEKILCSQYRGLYREGFDVTQLGLTEEEQEIIQKDFQNWQDIHLIDCYEDRFSDKSFKPEEEITGLSQHQIEVLKQAKETYQSQQNIIAKRREINSKRLKKARKEVARGKRATFIGGRMRDGER